MIGQKFLRLNPILMLFCVCIFFLIPQPFEAYGKETNKNEASLNELKNEILSYFEPVTGKIVFVQGKAVGTDIGSKRLVRPKMRLYAFKEGVDFIHPVTKEPLGKVEMPVGNIEITSAGENDSSGIIVKGKPDDFVGAKIKIQNTKTKVLFYQGNVDWHLGDSYYQMLKESGRFDLIDTALETDEISKETDEISKIISDAGAKGAEVALILRSEDAADNVNLTQRLFWVSDSKEFSKKTVPISISFVKELKFKSGLFGPKEGDVLLSFRLPFGTTRLAVGDIDGNGEPEIIFATGDRVKIYSPGVDLKFLWEFKLPSAGEILWIDTIDANKNKKDEILITVLSSNEVISYIYELDSSSIGKGGESGFVQLYKAKDTFIRRLENGIVGQRYNKSEGYDGSVFYISYSEGIYKDGDKLKLLEGVNIYDFQFVRSVDGRQAIISWDDNGYINLYNDKGVRTWNSKESMGGFLTEFKKESLSMMVDKGTWSVKDRLIIKNNEVFAPKRKPLVGVAKGLGYKSSEIRSFWWNGISVEERGLFGEIGGEILDYAIVGDRIIVLSKPLFGIRPKNILKGENPFGIMLYIFSLKGR